MACSHDKEIFRGGSPWGPLYIHVHAPLGLFTASACTPRGFDDVGGARPRGARRPFPPRSPGARRRPGPHRTGCMPSSVQEGGLGIDVPPPLGGLSARAAVLSGTAMPGSRLSAEVASEIGDREGQVGWAQVRRRCARERIVRSGCQRMRAARYPTTDELSPVTCPEWAYLSTRDVVLPRSFA